MGTFRVEIQGVGNHGCGREVKDSGTLQPCGSPGCVDCITREYLDKLKASGVFYDSHTDPKLHGSARLIHWPGQRGEVIDDLLNGVRSGNF